MTYLSPKLMEELKDRAVRVTVAESGTLVWVKDAGSWFWLEPWQERFVRDAARDAALGTRTRVIRQVPPPPALLEELDRIDREGEDGERLKVLGRLFEELVRRDVFALALDAPNGQLRYLRADGMAGAVYLGAEQREAVRGIV